MVASFWIGQLDVEMSEIIPEFILNSWNRENIAYSSLFLLQMEVAREEKCEFLPFKSPLKVSRHYLLENLVATTIGVSVMLVNCYMLGKYVKSMVSNGLYAFNHQSKHSGQCLKQLFKQTIHFGFINTDMLLYSDNNFLISLKFKRYLIINLIITTASDTDRVLN